MPSVSAALPVGACRASSATVRLTLLVLVAVTAAAFMRGKAGTPAVEAEMRNVDLHLTPEIGLHIRSLRGRFVAQGSRPAPYLDDPRSYSVTVDRGEVAVDLASLNVLMSRALVGHSNVRSMEISIDEDGGLRQKGTLKKGLPPAIRCEGERESNSRWASSYSLRVREGIRHPRQSAAQGFRRQDGRSL